MTILNGDEAANLVSQDLHLKKNSMIRQPAALGETPEADLERLATYPEQILVINMCLGCLGCRPADLDDPVDA
jgi:hypothetical protein